MKENISFEIKLGKGKEYDLVENLTFESEYLNGLRNGKGKEYDYKGEYLNGLRNGKGINYEDKQNIYEGEYLKGKIWYGKGIEKNEIGTIYAKSEYLNGKKNRQIKEYYSYGNLKFEGEYLNGEKIEKGSIII